MSSSFRASYLDCLLTPQCDIPDFERLTRPERGSAREGERPHPDRLLARSPLEQSGLKTVTQSDTQSDTQLAPEPSSRRTASPKTLLWESQKLENGKKWDDVSGKSHLPLPRK